MATPASFVWVQVYYEDKEEPDGNAFFIETASLVPPIVAALTKAVKTEVELDAPVNKIYAYPPGTKPPFRHDGAIDGDKPVPTDTAYKHPLIVVAPPPLQPPTKKQKTVPLLFPNPNANLADQILWQSLGKFKVVEQPRCLVLQGSFDKWLQTGSCRLYIQSAYPKLYKCCKKRHESVKLPGADGAFIVGNPGTGKSCFLDYALYKYLKLGKKVLYIHEGSNAAYQFSDGDVQQCLTGVRMLTERHSLGNFAKEFDVVLLEPHEQTPSNIMGSFLGGTFYIAAMSLDIENYKKLRKDTSWVYFCLGVLSRDDMLSMWDSCYKDRVDMEVLVRRYDAIGGIARHLFQTYTPTSKGKDPAIEYFERQQQNALANITDISRKVHDVDNPSDLKGRWALYHMIPSNNFETFSVVPPNEKTRLLIEQKLLQQNVAELWSLYRDTEKKSGALRGMVYECYVHKKILADGLKATAHRLVDEDGSRNHNKNKLQVNVPKGSREVKFESNDLNALSKALDTAKTYSEGAYVIPMSPNFPVLDSVFVKNKDVFVFQIKAGQSEPLSRRTKEILETCGTTMLIFLTPNDSVMQKPLGIKKATPPQQQPRRTRETEQTGENNDGESETTAREQTPPPHQYRLFVKEKW